MAIKQLREEQFERLLSLPEIAGRLGAVTPDHWYAIRSCLLLFLVGGVLAFWGAYGFFRAGLDDGGALLALLLLAAIIAVIPLFRIRAHLRRPVLDKLAPFVGMDYTSDGFDLVAWQEAEPLLFGGSATTSFIDLLDEKKHVHALCQGEIARGEQKFEGLIFAIRRSAESAARTIAIPAGIAREPEGLNPVATGDSSFDSLLSVWSSDPAVAQRLMGDDLRALLAGKAASGPVYFFADRENVLVAGPGTLESEEEAKLRPRERIRAIFDNVDAALRMLESLRAAIR